MDISVSDNHDVTVPGGTEVTVKDAIVFEREGSVVGKLDIKCDFADLDPSLHQMATAILMKNRVRMVMPSREHLERMKSVEIRYQKRRAEYESLPWYKKMFKMTPYYGME